MPTTPRGYGLGCHKSKDDPRTLRLDLASLTAPAGYSDLRPNLPPVWDQGNTSSCTAYGTLAGVALQQRKQGAHVIDQPSHTFTYALTRKREGTFGIDEGANILDALKSVSNEGVCGSKNWPDGQAILEIDPVGWWTANHKPWDTHPPLLDGLYSIDADPIVVAKHHRVTTYRSVPRTAQAVQLSLSSGFGVIIGFEVYDSFENGGNVPLPSPGEHAYGGHCALVCGWNGRFILRNSWGQSWGDSGYAYLDPAYFDSPQSPVFEAWTIHAVAKG